MTARKLPRSGLVQPLIIRPFCPVMLYWQGFRAVLPYQHSQGTLITETLYA
jgi:hypothetical protein